MFDKISLILLFLICVSNNVFCEPWPIYPFDKQHKINGTFGECRSKKVDGVLIQRHHMHEGLDIHASEGTEVKPTLGGYVDKVDETKHYVRTIWSGYVDGIWKTFYTEYYHLKDIPNDIVKGTAITESKTLLGKTDSYNHLHLVFGKSIDEVGEVLNPLLYLDNYIDNRKPVFSFLNGIQVVEDLDETVEDDKELFNLYSIQEGDKVDILVDVHDEVEEGDNLGLFYIYLEIKNSQDYLIKSKLFYFNYWPDNYRPNPKLVYAPGSNTSKYIYNITNDETSNSFWDTNGLTEGLYTITIHAYDIEFVDNYNYIWTNEEIKSAQVWISGSAEHKIKAKGEPNENQ